MAADVTKDILLQINLSVDQLNRALDEAKQKGVEFSKNQDDIKKKMLDLEKAGKTTGTAFKGLQREYDNNVIAIKANNKEIVTYINQLVNVRKANEAEQGSLVQKRAALSAAATEYARYSEEAKNTDTNVIALGNNIRKLTDELKNEESALGDNRRNVGNYKQAIKEATEEAQRLRAEFGKDSDAAKEAAQKVANLKDELDDFNQEVNIQKDTASKFQAFGNSTQGIADGLANATSSLSIFGDVGETVAGSLSNFGGAIGVISNLPTIFKEAKLTMDALGFSQVAATETAEGLAVAQGSLLGPIGAVVAIVGVLTAAYLGFSEKTTAFTADNMIKQKELVADRYQYEIDLAKAFGKDTTVLEKKAINDKIKLNDEAIAAIRASQNKQVTEYNQGELVIKNVRVALTKEQNEQLSKLYEENKGLIRSQTFKDAQDSTARNKEIFDDRLAQQKDFYNEQEAETVEHAAKQKQVVEQSAEEMLDEIEDAVNDSYEKIKETNQAQAEAGIDNFKLIFEQEQDFLSQGFQDRIAQNQLNFEASAQTSSDITNFKLEQLKIQEEQELQTSGRTAQQRDLIERKYARLRLKIAEDAESAKLSLISGGMNQVAGLFKKNTAAYKILAASSATLDTYQAVNKTLAAFSGVPIPGYAIAQAAITFATGFANVAKIIGTPDGGQGFYDGGYTGDGNPRQVSTTLGNRGYKYHKREYVVPDMLLNMEPVSSMVGYIESLRVNRSNPLKSIGGYAVGGFVDTSFTATGIETSLIQQKALASEIVRAIQLMPPPIVTVEDINAGQSSVQVRESRAIS